MGLLAFSIVVCGSVILVEWCLAKKQGIGGRILTTSFIVGPVGLVLMLPAVLLFGLTSFLLGVILCFLPRPSPSFVRIGLLLSAAVSFGIPGLQAYESLRKVQALRKKYPKVSLESRLAYELHSPAKTIRLSDPKPATLSDEVETQLCKDQERLQHDHTYRSRSAALNRLHTSYAEDFAIARNFGVSRMGGMGFYYLELPPQPTPFFPKPQKTSESNVLPDVAAAYGLVPPKEPRFRELHDQSRFDFFNQDRMGYVEDVNNVIGFIPHRFSQAPTLREDCHQESATPTPWIVTRVNLIGILKSEKPRVYLTEEFPDMAKLENVPVRPLDSFETTSLSKLRTEEDVVTEEHPARIRMVGSLRAAETCLNCHSVNRGELLGAFTYEIEPAIQIQKQEKKETGAMLRKRTLLSVGRM